VFSFVSLKIRVNLPIVKLDGLICGFFMIVKLLSKFRALIYSKLKILIAQLKIEL